MNAQELAGDHTILTSHETLFGGSGGQLWGCLVRRCLMLLACIVLAAFAGCVVIPMPEHALLEGRGEIDESDIAFLEEGKTTREDVLLRFGEPDVVLRDQRILAYHWEVSKGIWLLVGAGPYGAGGAAGIDDKSAGGDQVHAALPVPGGRPGADLRIHRRDPHDHDL